MSRARLLLLCPGQGGQHPAMFDLARTSPAASALLDRLPITATAEDNQGGDGGGGKGGGDGGGGKGGGDGGGGECGGEGGGSSGGGGSSDGGSSGSDIYANRHAQPLIVAATLGMWEAIRHVTPAPALVAGYSIGELAAYGVAGALTPENAVALAARRAQLMDDSLALHPGQSLVSISGLTLQAAATLAAIHDFAISIETGEDTCITGGPAAKAPALEQAVTAAGGRASRLPVEVASHTHYMESAVAPFAEALRQTDFGPITTPVLAGINAASITSKAQAVDLLSRQLAEKIHWLSCMDAASEAGISYALELGPGNALTRMLQNRHPHINTRSVADFRTLDGISKWLSRAAED